MLNEQGIIPDLITIKSNVKKEEAEQFYGEKINFRLKEILIDIKVPADFHILFFNLFIRLYLKNYELVINSSNSSFLLPSNIPLLSYVHYPRKDRLLSKKLSIHFPDGENKKWLKYSHSYYNIAAILYRFNRKINSNEKLIANSKFTKEALLRNYPLKNDEIKIVYPPVWKDDSDDKKDSKNYKMICSLGRFAQDKRQIEQMQIAEKLTGFQFHLMGFAKENDPYYKDCKHLKEKKKLSNVFLYPTVDYTEMNQIFKESGFFIHSLRNEPFGIVTVEAIANKCIPIVHNSGGQKEIVNNAKLRYNTFEDAIAIFENLATLDKTVFENWIENLTQNVRQFNYIKFSSELAKFLKAEFSNLT